METVEVGYLDCAQALVVSARACTESRGGHYRDDHPLRDDANWLKHTLAYRNDDGSIRLDFKPVKMGPYVPMERSTDGDAHDVLRGRPDRGGRWSHRPGSRSSRRSAASTPRSPRIPGGTSSRCRPTRWTGSSRSCTR